MDCFENGKYYLVACYSDKDVELLEIDKNWYCKGPSDKRRRVDIAAIDYCTSFFSNMDALKKQMLKKGYIKDSNVDLYIVSKSKYKGKEILNEYEILFKSERTPIFLNAAKKRFMNEKTSLNDIDQFLNKFITKVFYRKSFFEFITCPYLKLDKKIQDEFLIINNKKQEILLNDPNAKLKSQFYMKHKYESRFTSYITLRNIITAWNTYDELVEKCKKECQNDIELSKKIKDLYFDTYENKKNRLKVKPYLLKITDKDYMEGQVEWDEYMKTVPFDSPELNELEEKYGTDKMFSYLTYDILEKINNGDKTKLMLINPVAIERIEHGKRYR